MARAPDMDRRARFSYISRMSHSSARPKISFGQLGGLRGLMRNPGLFLMTLRHGGFAGRDALGNLYFERASRPGITHTRRWVVYKGAPEASVIGPEWHAWLHHLTDAPLPETGAKPWQKPHQPNLTGTAASYRPAGHDYEGGRRARASADYEAWTPDQAP